MLWSPGRKEPILKYCLTLTHVGNSPKYLPPGNWFWNINMWAFSISQTSVLRLACLLMAGFQKDPLAWPNSHLQATIWPSASPIVSLTVSHHALCGVVSINRACFSSLGNWLLTCFQSALSSLISKMSQTKSHLDEMHLGGCTLPASAERLEQPPRV